MTDKKPDFSDVRTGSSSRPTPRADFSDVRTGSSTVHGEAPARRTHTVARGETLSHIAKDFYGEAGRWRAIFEANRDQLDNPDLIHPGQVLVIPELDEPVRTPPAR